MDAAENRGGYTFIFSDFSKKIYRALEEGKKDNNFIYHAKIPELSSLPSLGKHPLAKASPIPEKFSSNFSGKPFRFFFLITIISVLTLDEPSYVWLPIYIHYKCMIILL
jgi:programmed cell death 6-interacting protein